MKILFICGSLEPGSDGVGDYTRRLSGELLENGHDIEIISLNDKSISTPLKSFQYEESHKLSVLRLPKNLSWRKRYQLAKIQIDNFNPEWVSLQYVCFSFQVKGLPWGFGSFVKKLSGNRKCHVMFHELWVGMDEAASRKHIYWGYLQKLLIQNLLKRIRPKVIHTQTRLYQLQLQKIGFNAQLLPLFSNIPVLNTFETRPNSMEPKLTEQTLLFVLFGGIHPGAPIKEIAQEAAAFSKETNQRIMLKIIGQNSEVQQTEWASTWRSAGLDVEILGAQPAHIISEVLAAADIGISTTPLSLVEKSGTVAAMRDHGLPVWCVTKSWKPRGVGELSIPDGIFEYQSGKFKEGLTIRGEKTQYGFSVSKTAKTLINVLTEKI